MSVEIYSPNSFKRYFNRRTARIRIKKKLDMDIIPRGKIAIDTTNGAYGVFDANGNFVKSSRQIRRNNSQFVPKHPVDEDYVDADAIFLGNVYPQFGHFILEHMNRAWGAIPHIKGTKVVLINNQAIEKVPQYMFVLIQMLGVPASDIMILNKTTRFRNVIIPHQGFNIPVWSSNEFASAFAHIASRVRAPRNAPTKIYVSRDHMGAAQTYGEVRIQKIFEKNGFTIIRPEQLSLQEQVGLMKNCRVLAGCAGTALHLALFMQPGGRVISLKRNSARECNAPIQHMLNKTCGHDGVFVWASVEEAPTRHSTTAPQIIGVTEHLKKFFDENGFKYTKNDLAPDVTAQKKYDAAMTQWRAEHGSVRGEKIKRAVIKITACLVPGRTNRARFRKYLKSRLI